MPGAKGRGRLGRVVVLVALALGVALAVHLIGMVGWHEVGQALRAIGLDGFALLILVQLFIILVLAAGWWVLLPGRAGIGLKPFFWARLVRDSASEILPLSQLGGFALGARTLTILGAPASLTVASTLVDVTLEVAAQLAFTVLGLQILAIRAPHAPYANTLAIVSAGLALGIAGFAVVQRHGGEWLARIATRLGGRWAAAIGSVERALKLVRVIHANPKRLAACFLLHLGAWIGTGSSAWLVLQLMGRPLHYADVLAIEGLLYAVRSAAFFVPNAIGVQEGAYITLGALFGMAPDTALALSLLKRGRDAVIGAPVLLFWVGLEGRRALKADAAVAPAPDQSITG